MSKNISDGVDELSLNLEFTDELKGITIPGKGIVNKTISSLLFEHFEERGVPTHYIDSSGASSQIVGRANMIPLQVIVRNYTEGSFCRRYGVEPGRKLESVVVEFKVKDERLHNPYITPDAAVALDLVTEQDVDEILKYIEIINKVAQRFFNNIDLTLIDFKVEFGLDIESMGELVLADEFSLDTCRVYNSDGRPIFRGNMTSKEVATVYETVMRKVSEIKN